MTSGSLHPPIPDLARISTIPIFRPMNLSPRDLSKALAELRRLLPPRISSRSTLAARDKCWPGGNLAENAANASSADGAARQKPGRITVRHFCDWLDSGMRLPGSTASPSPRVRGTRISDRAAVRQTGGVYGRAQLVSGPVRGRPEDAMGTVEGLLGRNQGDCKDWKMIGWSLAGRRNLSCGGAPSSVQGRREAEGPNTSC